jgi:hypothetical protein
MISDFMLGGSDNFRPDRDIAAEIGRACSGACEVALSGRELLARAVTWAAARGVSQFIDLGCGFPVEFRHS